MTRAQETLATLLNAWYRCPCGNDRFRRSVRGQQQRKHLYDDLVRGWRCTTCGRPIWLRKGDEPGRVAGPPTNARVRGNAWERA